MEGVGRNMETTVGDEVEYNYKTEKRGKKLEAVMVRLVKNVECRSRMVTHWVTKQLAEVIRSEVVVLVYRRQFVPGGFDSDIEG